MAFENMRGAAERLRWKLEPAEPSGADAFSIVTITGESEGVPVRIERRPAEYSLVTTALISPQIPFEFAITHEGIGGALANLLGFHDVAVGDAEFDKSFRVVSHEADAIKRLLTADAKAALHALSTQARRGHINPLGLREFYVSQGTVVISRVVSAAFTSVDDVVADVPFVVAAARALRDAARAR